MRRLQIIISLSLILFFTAATSAKIVFSSYQFPDSDIFVMDDDGSNIIQITDHAEDDKKPRWSPNGKKIAFLRDVNPSGTVHLNTFIMDADGTNVRQLTNYKGNDRGLAFSPDGKKLLVSSLSNTSGGPLLGLYSIDIETGDFQQISDFIIDDVDWSPDGMEIVFVNTDFNFSHRITENNIWMMNADGTNARPWTPPIKPVRTVDRYGSRWSPNGQQILYAETDINVTYTELENGGLGISRRTKGTYRYIIRNLNGRTQRLRIPENWVLSSVAWMDDGKSVLFSAFVDFDHRDEQNRTRWAQLYKYDIASGTITQLTHGRGSKWGVDWVRDDVSSVTSVSPAGKQSVRWGELKKTYLD